MKRATFASVAALLVATPVLAAETAMDPNCPMNGATAQAASSQFALTHSLFDWFTAGGHYMPRTHCMVGADGKPDWPWITALIITTATVVIGYLRIFAFWRKTYLAENVSDRNNKLMSLAYIFLLCAICGYAMSILSFVWPAYRLLVFLLIALNFVTYRFIHSINAFKVSFSARRLARELEESRLANEIKLADEVKRQTAILEQQNIELARSEARFNSMAANVPGMIYQIARDSENSRRFIYVSDKVAELLGWTPEQAVHVPDAYISLVAPAERAELNRRAWQSKDDGKPFAWEGHLTTAKGEEKYVRIFCGCRQMDDGQFIWTGIMQDITESHRTSVELEKVREETRKLALVAANTSNAVIITDAEGRIEWVNRGFTRISEYSLPEVVGRKPGSFLQGPQTARETVARVRESIHACEPVQAEILNYSKTGRPYWLHLEITPVKDNDGQVTHFMAIETDITQAKETEAELKRAREAAESASRAKSQFLANMSHEIRTPLAAVMGFSEMLCEEANAKPEDRQQWMEMVRSGGRHLLTLINDVLDVSKIEAGKMEFERLSVAPHEVLTEVASIMRVAAAEKSLNLSLSYANALPRQITTDPTRMRQVLINLVNNAIKFTQHGTVRLVALLEETGAEPQLVVHVADSGIGMTPDQQSRIFAPFVQADSTTTRKFGGTGLGLTISRHICQSLGGDLTVASTLGVGSTFTMRVGTGPLTGVERINAAEATVHATPHDIIKPKLDAESLVGRRLLVVDDGAANRKLISLVLRRTGADVTLAEHGREALDIIAAQPAFDVILLDMQMPIMDGYTTAKTLRSAGCTTPIIALTANAMAGDRQQCIDAGCTDYQTKPVNRDSLLQCVLQCIGDGSANAVEAKPEEPIVSQLPIEDPEFAEIAATFVDSAEKRLAEMQNAARESDYRQLARLAHWLKGSGGSAGYPMLTEQAIELEHGALQANVDTIRSGIEEIESLIRRSRSGLTGVATLTTESTSA